MPTGGPVLDVASGSGRHARLFLERGHDVVAVDADISGVADLLEHPHLEAVKADLEDGRAFLLAGRSFACVVVTNYLYRPFAALRCCAHSRLTSEHQLLILVWMAVRFLEHAVLRSAELKRHKK